MKVEGKENKTNKKEGHEGGGGESRKGEFKGEVLRVTT